MNSQKLVTIGFSLVLILTALGIGIYFGTKSSSNDDDEVVTTTSQPITIQPKILPYGVSFDFTQQTHDENETIDILNIYSKVDDNNISKLSIAIDKHTLNAPENCIMHTNFSPDDENCISNTVFCQNETELISHRLLLDSTYSDPASNYIDEYPHFWFQAQEMNPQSYSSGFDKSVSIDSNYHPLVPRANRLLRYLDVLDNHFLTSRGFYREG